MPFCLAAEQTVKVLLPNTIFTVGSAPAFEIASLSKKDFARKMLKTDMEQMSQQLSASLASGWIRARCQLL